MNELTRLDEALFMATSLGWFVFPIAHMLPDGTCSCGKPNDAPKHSPGKHPRILEWQKECSNNPAIIEAWWKKFPDSNIGLAMEQSGLYVIDIDPANGGSDSLGKLIDEHGDAFMSTLRVITGSKGLHLYYKQHKSMLRNTAGELGDGIDTRGAGGYVLLPSSNHKSGGIYEWAKNYPGPNLDYIADVPEWVVKKINEVKPKTGPAPPVPKVVTKGKRNQALLSVAGTLHRRNLPRRAILECLKAFNEESFQPPVPVADVEYVLDCVMRYKNEPEPQPMKAHIARSDDWWPKKW